MQTTREQLVEALDDMELDELLDLLEDCDDLLYWWLSDLYPRAELDEDLRSLLLWLQARQPDGHKFSIQLAEFVESDCALYSRVLAALGIPEGG